jgi:hypothetical protein
MKKSKPVKRPGLSAIPSVVQLPGGYRLHGLPFKVIERNPDGSPKTFELLPDGSRSDFVLYADKSQIRKA